MTERKNNGRFQQGQPSRNPRGRPRTKTGPLRTVADLNEVILRVGNQMVPQKALNDGLPPVTLFERNVKVLGVGQKEARLSARSFIDMVKSAAQQIENRRRLGPQHSDGEG